MLHFFTQLFIGIISLFASAFRIATARFFKFFAHCFGWKAAIPCNIQDLSLPFLNKVLNEEFVSFTVTPVSSSQESHVVNRITLRRKNEETKKTILARSKIQYFFVEVALLHSPLVHTEHDIFKNNLEQSLSQLIPTVYYCSPISAWNGDYLILLDDILMQGPWEHMDSMHGCSLKDAQFIVEQMARLHAHAWNNQAILKPLRTPKDTCAPPMYLQHAWPKFKRAFAKKKQFEQVLMLGNLFFVKYYDFVERVLETGMPNRTLLQNDWTLDSIAIRRHEQRLVLSNWMLASQGPCVLDLVQFLSTNIAAQDLPSMQPLLLQSYYQALQQNIASSSSNYSWQQFTSEFELAAATSVLSCLNMMRTLTRREKELAAHTLERINTFVQLNKTLDVFQNWSK